MKGIDIQASAHDHGGDLVKEGFQFVCRYYFSSSASKVVLTHDEALHLSSLGLILVAVFENGFPTTPGYFSKAKAVNDAAVALQCARNAHQPTGKPIYFAVDADIPSSRVTAYFRALNQALSGSGYKVGVYGPGAVCKALKSFGLVTHTWRSGSTGWSGYADWTPHANIVQTKLDQPWHGLTGGVDFDTSQTDEFGGWRVSV